MKNNVLYIWDADYPWDVRVHKICKTLVANGYNVHIASRNLNRNDEYELLDELHIHRLKTYSNNKLNYFFSFPAFFNPVWKNFLDKIINEQKIDIIIVRDLPMSIAGIHAGKRNDIPIIFDMAEDYLAMLKDIWKFKKFEGLNLFVRNPYFAKYIEKYAFKNMDHILVVVEEAQNVVITRGGLKEKTSIVSNTPPLINFDISQSNNLANLDKIKKHYSAIYTGGVTLGRGIQTVLNAIPKIIKCIPDFLFVIVGEGYAVPMLKDMIEKLNIKDYVLWLGWIDHEKMYNYINECEVGLIPHNATEHTDTTVPNKLFDYMGLGLPILASNAIPLQRILHEEKCGLSFKTGDTQDLAEKMIEIYSSQIEYGSNGRNAILNKYNWEEDTKRLIHIVKKLLSKN